MICPSIWDIGVICLDDQMMANVYPRLPTTILIVFTRSTSALLQRILHHGTNIALGSQRVWVNLPWSGNALALAFGPGRPRRNLLVGQRLDRLGGCEGMCQTLQLRVHLG